MEPSLLPPSPSPSRLPASGWRGIFLAPSGIRWGWRILLFSLIAGVLLSPIVLPGLLIRTPKAAARPAPVLLPWGVLLAEWTVFALVLLASWIMSKVERGDIADYGLPLARTSLSLFLRGCVFWGFIPLVGLLLSLRLLNVFHFGAVQAFSWQLLYWGALWFLAFFAVALAEEFFFRGYLLRTLAEGIGFWPAAIVLAVAFALAHSLNPVESRIGVIDTALFALFASVTLRRTGNLWLAVGAHAAWDWGQSFFFGVGDSGAQIAGRLFNGQIQGPAWLGGGSVGPEGSVLDLAVQLILTALFLALYSKQRPAADPSRKTADAGANMTG